MSYLSKTFEIITKGLQLLNVSEITKDKFCEFLQFYLDSNSDAIKNMITLTSNQTGNIVMDLYEKMSQECKDHGVKLDMLMKAFEHAANHTELSRLRDKQSTLLTHEIFKRFVNYPNDIVKDTIGVTGRNRVIVTMTTCKRLDLFCETMNSFLQCCLDRDLIDEYLVIDDQSSDIDVKKMKELYPFITLVRKEYKDKGHPKSMNIIRDYMRDKGYKYQFNLEDDWRFFVRDHYITKCLNVLENNKELGQCLLNKGYAEEAEGHNIIGGDLRTTTDASNPRSVKYYVHEYFADQHQLLDYLRKSENLNKPHCAYWPHFSFRVGMTRVAALEERFDETVNHFEMVYAHSYVKKGWKTAYFITTYCQHSGRKTWERGTEIKNAYDLNNEHQFTGKEKRKNERKEERKDEKKGEKEEKTEENESRNNIRKRLLELTRMDIRDTIKNKESGEKSVFERLKRIKERNTISTSRTPAYTIVDALSSLIDDRLNGKNIDIQTGQWVIDGLVKLIDEIRDFRTSCPPPTNNEIKTPRDNDPKISQPTTIKSEGSVAKSDSLTKPEVAIKSSLPLSQTKLLTRVVNLKRRPDRLKLFESRVPKDLNYKVFEAVDGTNIPSSDLHKILKISETNDFNWNAGAIGCACSHIKLWLELMSSDADYMTIFEDDAEFTPDFMKRYCDVLSKLHTLDLDLLYLGHFIYDNREEKKEYLKHTATTMINKLTREENKSLNLGGTYGYIISKRGAERMIQIIEKHGIFNGIDWVMIKAPVSVYNVKPHLVISKEARHGGDTDIQTGAKSLYISLTDRLNREMDFWCKELGCSSFSFDKDAELPGGIKKRPILKSRVNYTNYTNKLTENRKQLLICVNIVKFTEEKTKSEIISSIKDYPLYYYTIEDRETIRGHRDWYDSKIKGGYLFIVPETMMKENVSKTIVFQDYINNNFL